MTDIRSTSDRIFDVVNIILIIFAVLITIYPLYFILIASISSPVYTNIGQVVLYPRGIMFDGLYMLATTPAIWMGYRNTIIYAVLGTSINMFVTIPAAYALSRKDFRARKFVSFFFIFTMIFSGGMIPTFIVVMRVGLLDSMFALMIPNALSVWNMIVAKAFFDNMPYDMTEAAVMDGCSNTRLFITIILPLSKAMLAVIALFYVVGHWNAFFEAMIYLSSREKFPLQLILREILILAEMVATADGGMTDQMREMHDLSNLIRYSAVVVSTVPLLILYPFVQKYFTQGIMIGAVKG